MLTDELDFGSVKVGQSKTMKAFVENAANEVVSATVITSAPFSVTSPVELQPGVNEVSVTFTPTDAVNYNGTMTVHVNATDIVITLKGTGQEDGPLAIRNKEFFEGITYKWTDDNGNKHRSNLSEVATDPNQIIAMIKEVYTNKSIPGNYKRGCDANGNFTETWSDVSYPAIGTLSFAGTTSANLTDPSYYSWNNAYGWGIGTKKPVICNVNTSYSTNYPTYYTHFDQTEYKPYNEGVTLLLLEVADGYDLDKYTIPTVSDYASLKGEIGDVIKSARIVTQAMRVGENKLKGTLFNVECDKMNKFFFMAKGQLREPFNSMMAYYGTQSYNANAVFCPYPMYVYSQDYFYDYDYHTVDKYVDYVNGYPFYQMFEQFSPVSLETGGNIDDLYSSLCDLASFNVIHDCITVPFATTTSEGNVHHGHQFMMYGVESDAADCQDVRDMMFFVPDYRMMSWSGRNSTVVPYTNYNQTYAPKMGLFVIRQDKIPEGTTVRSDLQTMTGLYKHQLKWRSNLGDFLPGDEQYYELWELVVDEFGKESYQPVYYRNANGDYTDAKGTVVSTPVQIVLDRKQLTSGGTFQEVTETVNDKQVKKLLYTDIYVDMKAGSQTKTYVVRGRDSKNFLSLQMSNQEEIVIPGLDPNEKVRLIGATYYSRYNPNNQMNCYSNKLEMKNNATGLTRSDVTGKTIKFYRLSHAARVDAEGNVVTDAQGNIQYKEQAEKFLFATGTINGSNLDITLNGQADARDFPAGASDAQGGNVTNYAGYHANGSLSFPFTENPDDHTLNFGNLVFWDNFTVDVSENKHPLQYLYHMEVGAADSDVADAYSNNVRVPVYKTASRINPPLTLEQVIGDVNHNPEYTPGDVEFGAQVQLSSKTEILRYDAYRWDENTTKRFIVDKVYNNDTEQDLPPTGMAGNQGEWYTVTMNDEDDSHYYYSAPAADQPAVTTDQPLNWATFIDYYPKKLADATNEGMAYVYAPVVELFSKGYNATNASLKRTDYNTYGGPMQKSAVGKVDAEFVTVDGGYETSTMTWQQNGKTYCYYNLPVRLKVFDIPAGYEVYKVRAWRQVDESLLGECPQSAGPNVPDRSDRISGDYMFEELTYGDEFNISGGVRLQAFKEVPGGYELGDRARPNGENNERMATFGAVKLENGQTMDVTVIVRVYFTKANADAAMQPAGGPRRALTLENLSADGKYYVAEKVVTRTLSVNNVITAVNSVKANREVMGVNYVNTMGQVANRPWQGVNVVITRYTDGTTKTTKAVY